MRNENEVIHHCTLKQTKKMVKIFILCKKSRNFSHNNSTYRVWRL